MKTRVLLSVFSILVLAAVAVAPVTAVAKGKKAGPTVVGEDPADDWGATVNASLAPIGDALGQELVSASIGMADAKTVNLIIGLKSLPPTGGVPELSRYNWDFTVDGEAFQITGGYTEFIRGVCNPLHTNGCPPPQNPGMQPFFVRQGACVVAAPPDCTLLATVQATFDPATGTITVPIPLTVLKAKPGSKIGPGSSASFGGTIYTAPQAVVSQNGLPHDTMMALGTFKIPKK